jgi:hypothetical protein
MIQEAPRKNFEPIRSSGRPPQKISRSKNNPAALPKKNPARKIDGEPSAEKIEPRK